MKASQCSDAQKPVIPKHGQAGLLQLEEEIGQAAPAGDAGP